jgi:predicted ATPase
LNLLIGPNASGKSNVLRSLELLSIAARGGLGKHVQREGGMEPLVWDGKSNDMLFRAKMTPMPPLSDPTTDALTYELAMARLGNSSAFAIEKETLGNYARVETGEMTEPFKLLERSPHHAVVFSMDSKRFEAPPESVPEDETLLSIAAGPFAANRYVDGFQRELSSWSVFQYFSTDREAPIRAPQVTRADSQVDADGQNLISVLHTLYQSDRGFKAEINTAMRSAFGDDFEELVFPPAADNRIQLGVRWGSLNRARSAADLSDGTLRFLFLLAVLANPAPPPVLAIDEPETGLHPSMFPIIAEYARDAASRTQVMLTTHSPEFLDAFGQDPITTTTIVERHEGETVLRTLDRDELAYWLKQYSLDELFRSKELEAMK